MIPKKRYYGKGRIAHFSPPTLQTGAKMVNCYVNFVELLQIKAAIDDAVTHMNRNNRSTREGRDALVNLCVHLDDKTLTVAVPRCCVPQTGRRDTAHRNCAQLANAARRRAPHATLANRGLADV